MDGYLSIAEAAILCRRPYISMYSLATAGKLGLVHRVGRNYLLTVEGVEAYRASQAEKHASSAK